MDNHLDKMRRVSAPFRQSESVLIKSLDAATKEKVTVWPKFKTVVQKQYGVGAGSVAPGSKYKTRDNLQDAPSNSKTEAASGAATARDVTDGNSSSSYTYTSNSSGTPSNYGTPGSGDQIYNKNSQQGPIYESDVAPLPPKKTGGGGVTSGEASANSNSEYHCIDTRVMDNCINKRESFISRYDEIVTFYDEIIKGLEGNWEGKGADTFFSDAKEIRTNITGIADILAHMCNALRDCRDVVADCDSSLADLNRNPDGE